MFQASFHTIVTLRAFWYAPPDTRVPNLQLVSVEHLPSIEGALEIQIDVTFLRGKGSPGRGGLGERTPMASPMRGSCRRKATDEVGAVAQMRCLHLIRHGSAMSPSPHRGRLFLQKAPPVREGLGFAYANGFSVGYGRDFGWL